jgi:hypothetical protein
MCLNDLETAIFLWPLFQQPPARANASAELISRSRSGGVRLGEAVLAGLSVLAKTGQNNG